MCVGGGGEDLVEAWEVAGEDGIVEVGGRSILGGHDGWVVVGGVEKEEEEVAVEEEVPECCLVRGVLLLVVVGSTGGAVGE